MTSVALHEPCRSASSALRTESTSIGMSSTAGSLEDVLAGSRVKRRVPTIAESVWRFRLGARPLSEPRRPVLPPGALVHLRGPQPFLRRRGRLVADAVGRF